MGRVPSADVPIEPNHPLGYVPPHHGRDEAELRAALGLDQVAAAAKQPRICDFCEKPAAENPAAWYYPMAQTMTVNIGGVPVEMQAPGLAGPWHACDTCHQFVERGDYHGLAVHMGYGAGDMGYEPGENLPPSLDHFSRHRVGPAQHL